MNRWAPDILLVIVELTLVVPVWSVFLISVTSLSQ
jgi:hypothetical protein